MTPMRHWTVVLALAVCPSAASAGSLELAVRAGQVFPFYEQSVHFDPGPFLRATFPNIDVQPVEDLRLEASGGLALSGGLTWYVTDAFGLEGRLDTGDLSVDAQGGRVAVRIPLPPPLPALSTDITIPATVDVERVKPISLNLRVRSPGSFRVYGSGGVSYLPSLSMSVHATFRAGSPIFSRLPLDLANLAVRAEARPEGDGQGGRVGFNAGAGVEWAVGRVVSVEVDARYFRFKEQTLSWSGEPGLTLSPIEQQLLRELLNTLGESRFNPNFFQVTGGVSFRF
jgi:hypothetical protein